MRAEHKRFLIVLLNHSDTLTCFVFFSASVTVPCNKTYCNCDYPRLYG